ncbi:response regulator [Motiliproteus sp. SC1-56]|uniref:hybrid sensor histidine kinase/response regulator n=1 Tax=Motiliproteus sp. SC1-56 TaxID=2799565 RepID=UPI001A8FF093|nr:response regulator [Motiliproteus sp. SC1-56]
MDQPKAPPPLILLVEDDPGIRRLCDRALRAWGLRTEAATGPEQALPLLNRLTPDLVLWGLPLATADGLELLRRLEDCLDAPPMVVAASHDERDEALRLLAGGAYALLDKPLDNLELLRHTVNRGLEWRTLRQQRYRYHARLQQDVDARTAELRDLSQHLEHAREEEKRRIAKELHDELGMTLTALFMDLNWLREKLRDADEPVTCRLTSMHTLLEGAVKTSRRIIRDLRPSVLDNLGLIAALEWQAVEFNARYRIPCRVEHRGDDNGLSDTTRITLFRIFQEALTNVARHAGAKEIRAALTLTHGRAALSVHDDGSGFDPARVSPASHGLLGMRERLHQCGGKLTIESAPGRGTRLCAALPLQPQEVPA